MPQSANIRDEPRIEWWERLLSCGVLFHDFEIIGDAGGAVQRCQCKKCGHFSVYQQDSLSDGNLAWRKVDPELRNGSVSRCSYSESELSQPR